MISWTSGYWLVHGVLVLDPEPDILADEAEPAVAGQRARQQVRFAQDLEAVADPEHRQASPRGGHKLGLTGANRAIAPQRR